MNSRIYECRVVHERKVPKRHRFAYRVFMLALDLDEIREAAPPLKLFSVDSWNVCSLQTRDYLPVNEKMHNPTPGPRGEIVRRPPPGADLKTRVAAFLHRNEVGRPPHRVELVTMPRIFGYHFNPVSFYFCYDGDGSPLAAIAEVTNTFRENKPFFLGPESWNRGAFRLRLPKHFYVSPFSDVDVAFDFVIRPAGRRLRVKIDDFENGRTTLTSALAGKAVPLSDRNLLLFLVKYPLLTIKVITLIHWHALLLFLKRVPWFRKAARRQEQRDLYRPHASLTGPHPVKQ